MNLYRILRISGGRRRRQAQLLTPFIGREKDLGVLARCSARSLAGEGQFVLVLGEPGIGKSHWLKSFAASWPTDDTLGSNGVRLSCYRTRRCTLSSGGDASGSADLRWHPSGGWPNSNRFSLTSSSTPGSSLASCNVESKWPRATRRERSG